MGEIPRFEILDQIGHGQFSTVYKARWINAPLTPLCAPVPPGCEQQAAIDSIMQPFPATNCELAKQKQILKSTNQFDLNELSMNQQQQQKPEGPDSHKYVALKRIKFYDIQNSKLRMDYFKEVKLLQQLKHPNIINYNISFIERNELFIVLELADGGDLSKLIKYFQRRNQLLSERTILKYFTQVCSAVRYIHSKRILHRDIKPANIFMTSSGCVKLGDFGLGRFFSQNTRDAHSIVGTFYYMSPERIRESGYGFSSDIWSLGCVLYELITLNSPFSIITLGRQNNLNQMTPPLARPQENNNPFRKPAQQQSPPPHQPPPPQPQQQQNTYNLAWHIERIIRAEYPSLAPYVNISLRLRQLTTECLNPDPEARPNMEYICAVVYEAYRVQQLASSTTSSNSTISASATSSATNRTSKPTAVACRQ